MMEGPSILYSLPSLLYLVLHIVAFSMGLAYWRRYPNVCLLVLIGASLNIFAIVTRIALTTFWNGHFGGILPPVYVQFGVSIIGITGSALYLLAIFSGRGTRPTRSRDRGYDDDWRPPATPAGSTGIQEPRS